jgi:hypothetical protein
MQKVIRGSNCTCNCLICGSTITNPTATNPTATNHVATNCTAYCKANVHIFFGVTQMWERIVYKKGEFMQWHKRECLLGECDKCGVYLLTLCLKEIERSNDNVVAWKQFSLEQTIENLRLHNNKL